MYNKGVTGNAVVKLGFMVDEVSESLCDKENGVTITRGTAQPKTNETASVLNGTLPCMFPATAILIGPPSAALILSVCRLVSSSLCTQAVTTDRGVLTTGEDGSPNFCDSQQPPCMLLITALIISS